MGISRLHRDSLMIQCFSGKNTISMSVFFQFCKTVFRHKDVIINTQSLLKTKQPVILATNPKFSFPKRFNMRPRIQFSFFASLASRVLFFLCLTHWSIVSLSRAPGWLRGCKTPDVPMIVGIFFLLRSIRSRYEQWFKIYVWRHMVRRRYETLVELLFLGNANCRDICEFISLETVFVDDLTFMSSCMSFIVCNKVY